MKMKSQTSLEFVVSVGVILGLLSFVTIAMTRSVNLLQDSLQFQHKRAIAWQLSELLISYPGYPANWSELEDAKVIGFSAGEPRVLKASKVQAINACSSREYELLLEKLGLKRNSLILKFEVVNESSTSLFAACYPPVVSKLASRAKVTRLALLDDGRIVKLELIVY